MRRWVRRTSILATAIVAGLSGLSGTVARASSTPALPPVGHVFVINLENKGFTTTFGPGSPAPYLAHTLTSQGVLLSQYYGTGHESNDNYISQISGQGPNLATQTDCQIYVNFLQVATLPPGQAVGQGCVYPAGVQTVANQLAATGRTWKAYMEDMGNIATREPATCAHPAINAQDGTQTAVVGDQYATRHNPFVYFHSIIDTPACKADVVPLTRLPLDLGSAKTTANLTYITPNLCNDGHDSPCVDGRPGGLVSADAWLQTWVPRILSSAAYRANGMLVVTFDESDGPQSDSSACCGEGPGPNSPLPGITGFGGGRVGAVVLSRWIRPGSSNDTPYNHYSLLSSVEQVFHLSRLGYAAGATPFGLDVFTNYQP
jgi:hypothetical protein